MGRHGVDVRNVHVTTHIPADPAEVWSTLVQTDRWSTWDPALVRVDGELVEGGTVTFHVTHSNRPFTSKVVEWRPGCRLALRGGLPLGLFTGTRTYSLQPAASGAGSGTTFTMAEEFTGVLRRLIVRTIPDLRPSFDAFARGLADESAAR